MAINLQPKRARKWGYIVGGLIGIICALLPWLPGMENVKAIGPHNTGHTNFKCQACHKPTSGIFVRHKKVDSNTCLECHQRKNDSHSIERFKGPKHAKVRAILSPHKCTSCHKQHKGVRVTTKPTFCQHCHQTLKVEFDPLTPTHEELTKKGQWNTCMRCHDYHGNHIRRRPKRLEDAAKEDQVIKYFLGGPSPYSDKKVQQPKKPK